MLHCDVNVAQLCEMRPLHYAILNSLQNLLMRDFAQRIASFLNLSLSLSLSVTHTHALSLTISIQTHTHTHAQWGCELITFSRVKWVHVSSFRSCNTILSNDNPSPYQPQSAGNIFLNLYRSGTEVPRGLWVIHSQCKKDKRNIYSMQPIYHSSESKYCSKGFSFYYHLMLI